MKPAKQRVPAHERGWRANIVMVESGLLRPVFVVLGRAEYGCFVLSLAGLAQLSTKVSVPEMGE